MINAQSSAGFGGFSNGSRKHRVAVLPVRLAIPADPAPDLEGRIVQVILTGVDADGEAAVARLEAKDLALARDGQVLLAYPFAGMPTAFSVLLPGGRQRYAVCAIDALGMPALLGEPVVIRSHCHHCREPLEITARPDGPMGSAGIMVWVGERGGLRDKAFDSL